MGLVVLKGDLITLFELKINNLTLFDFRINNPYGNQYSYQKLKINDIAQVDLEVDALYLSSK